MNCCEMPLSSMLDQPYYAGEEPGWRRALLWGQKQHEPITFERLILTKAIPEFIKWAEAEYKQWAGEAPYVSFDDLYPASDEGAPDIVSVWKKVDFSTARLKGQEEPKVTLAFDDPKIREQMRAMGLLK